MADDDSQFCDSSTATIPAIDDDGKGGEKKRKAHRLKQRFKVVKKLGQGTYGKVQLAINNETGQEVAIKTIKKSKVNSQQDLIRIRREIQIMSSIHHPHIIHIYEVFENKDKIVLVMQYASGGELYDYVSYHKVLSDTEARRLFRQIATAIYYCHKYKICHRDLKLENIILDDKGNAKIADFGLSNVFDEKHFLQTFCGSPLYASPEIVRGLAYFGPEVDCWSLGVLLYTLVYGAMPFDGSNFKKLVKQISESNYFEPPNKSGASDLIKKLLAPNPQERATIIDICTDPWVNAEYEHSLLQFAEDLSNLTPVRLDLILALAPTSPTEAKKLELESEEAKSEALPAAVNDGNERENVKSTEAATTNKRPAESADSINVTAAEEQKPAQKKQNRTESSEQIAVEEPSQPAKPEVAEEPKQPEEPTKPETSEEKLADEPCAEPKPEIKPCEEKGPQEVPMEVEVTPSEEKSPSVKEEKVSRQNSVSSEGSTGSTKRPGRVSIPKIWDNNTSAAVSETDKKSLFIPVSLKVSEAKKVIERRCSVDGGKSSTDRRDSVSTTTELEKKPKKKYKTRSLSAKEITITPAKTSKINIIKEPIPEQEKSNEEPSEKPIEKPSDRPTSITEAEVKAEEKVPCTPSTPGTPITEEDKSIAKHIIQKNIAKAKLMEKRQISTNSTVKANDSSETIPLVSIENSKVSLRQDSNQKVNNESFQSDFSTLRTQDSRDNVLSVQPTIAAPITRSYKKVTFTKDGACITETGKVYTTEGKDGVTTMVEKKSKVTHIVGGPGAASIQRSDSGSSGDSMDLFDEIFDDHWTGGVFSNVKSIFSNFFDTGPSRLAEKRSLRNRAESLERNNWFAKSNRSSHKSLFDEMNKKSIFDSSKSLFSKSLFSSSLKSSFDKEFDFDNSTTKSFTRDVRRDGSSRVMLPRISRILKESDSMLSSRDFSDYDQPSQDSTRRRVEQWLQSDDNFDDKDSMSIDTYGTIGPRGSRRCVRTFTTNDTSNNFFKKVQVSAMKSDSITSIDRKTFKHTTSGHTSHDDAEEKEVELNVTLNNSSGDVFMNRATVSTLGNEKPKESEIKVPEQSSLLEQLRTYGYKNLVSRRLSDASSTEDIVQTVNDSLSSLNLKQKDNCLDAKCTGKQMPECYGETASELLTKRKMQTNCSQSFDKDEVQMEQVENQTSTTTTTVNAATESVSERIHRKSYYSRFNEDTRSTCRQRRRSVTRFSEFSDSFSPFFASTGSSSTLGRTKSSASPMRLQSFTSYDPDRSASFRSSFSSSSEFSRILDRASQSRKQSNGLTRNQEKEDTFDDDS